MVFILTNIASFLLIGFLLVWSYFLQAKKHFKIFTSLNLSLAAIFCALSVVLTNVVGYSFIIFGVQIMLGNFLLFLTGMMFGPVVGSVSAIATDSIGALINMGGAYHAGFMLIKVILGFAGGFVFLFKTNAFWKTKMLFIFSLAYLLSSILSPVFLYTLYGMGYTMVKFLAKLMRLPFELALYNFLIYTTFKVSYLILSFNHQQRKNFWFMKNGVLKIRPKRSLREKYKLDLEGNHFQSRKETRIYYKKINYNIINGVVKNEKSINTKKSATSF